MIEKYLGDSEIREALTHYDLGDLITLVRIRRDDDSWQPVYVLKTTQGKFFVKQYWRFDENIMMSLGLMDFLDSKGYPVVKVYTTFEGKPYFKINNKVLSIFEFIDLKETTEFTSNVASELGKYLGRLHALTSDYPGKRTGQSLEFFLSIIKNHQELINKDSETKQVFEFVKSSIQSLNSISQDLPKAICHNEFTIEHTRFFEGKLVKVIDWETSRDPMLIDLGTTLMEVFKGDELNWEYFEAMLKAYLSERKLEEIELKYLFEAFVAGTAKFVLWELKSNKIFQSGVNHLDILRKIGKEEFDKRIRAMI